MVTSKSWAITTTHNAAVEAPLRAATMYATASTPAHYSGQQPTPPYGSNLQQQQHNYSSSSNTRSCRVEEQHPATINANRETHNERTSASYRNRYNNPATTILTIPRAPKCTTNNKMEGIKGVLENERKLQNYQWTTQKGNNDQGYTYSCRHWTTLPFFTTCQIQKEDSRTTQT